MHSGVVINGKEYAYGGHDRRGVTGVYWTRPRTEPPGGSFRTEILQGFTFATQAEIDAIVRHCSDEFQGPAYNLLTRNCNHFTSHLCQKLTGRPGPAWLNRAASIGVALPCVVPRDWIEPPDHEGVDGELLSDDRHGEHEDDEDDSENHDDDDDDDDIHGDSEQTGMLEHERRRGTRPKGKGKRATRDSSGRALPASERAPAE